MSAEKEAKTDPPMELMYWDGRGLMEVPRMLLAIAGKSAPADFKDGKYTTDADKIDGQRENGSYSGHYDEIADKMVKNLGRMPALYAGGESVGQSTAIYHYVATECGLMGSSTMEQAQIIGVAEHLKEMKLAYVAAVQAKPNADGAANYPYAPLSEEQAEHWFSGGSDDVSGPAVGSGRATRMMGWWLGRIEAAVGDNGFAVGNKLSLADVLVYNLLAETLPDEQAAPTVADHRKVPLGDAARTKAALAAAPRLSAIIASVAANEGAQRHLATRGVQRF